MPVSSVTLNQAFEHAQQPQPCLVPEEPIERRRLFHIY